MSLRVERGFLKGVIMNRAELQQLESRTLLSGVKLESDHVLDVNGKATTANTIIVGLNVGGTSVDVTLNGALDTFALSTVKKVRIVGGSAADTITIDETNGAFTLPTLILAGGGGDSITGGSGKTIIVTGKGADTVTVGNGNDTVLGHGDDVITAGNGNDMIVGGFNGVTGDDSITVGNGNDTVFSLAGHDTVTLGSGTDNVWADHDTINAGAGADTIFAVNPSSDDVIAGTGTVTDDVVASTKASGRVHEVIHTILDKAYWNYI
jgi:Ca2+-binding RTX toxin-like protein